MESLRGFLHTENLSSHFINLGGWRFVSRWAIGEEFCLAVKWDPFEDSLLALLDYRLTG